MPFIFVWTDQDKHKNSKNDIKLGGNEFRIIVQLSIINYQLSIILIRPLLL